MYDQETILKKIRTKWAGKTVHFAKETDATNEWIKRLSQDGAPHGTLAVAEFQSAGKGRLGRSWQAQTGSSVMMSLLLRPDFEPQYASMLTLVMGISVAQAIEKLGVSVSIKWPNDVVVSRKKICGVLTEMRLDGMKIRDVIIGTGINVDQEYIEQDLQDKATSLYLETGKHYERTDLISLVMEAFEENYEKFIQTCDLSAMLNEYNRLLANRDQEVRILDKKEPWEGTALGINAQGELLVKDGEGKIQTVRAGEVSVRGLYSYVYILPRKLSAG